MSGRPPLPPAVILSACTAALFAAASTATAANGAAARPTIVALNFEDIRSADALKQRLEEEVAAALEPVGLEFPNVTFHLPVREIDGAVSRALELIERQPNWDHETVIRACGPAAKLCFVITCKDCGGCER